MHSFCCWCSRPRLGTFWADNEAVCHHQNFPDFCWDRSRFWSYLLLKKYAAISGEERFSRTFERKTLFLNSFYRQRWNCTKVIYLISSWQNERKAVCVEIFSNWLFFLLLMSIMSGRRFRPRGGSTPEPTPSFDSLTRLRIGGQYKFFVRPVPCKSHSKCIIRLEKNY